SCGHSTFFDEMSTRERIAGGRPAIFGKFPWMVHFRYHAKDLNDFVKCGGTVVKRQWVLSAAHCFKFLEERVEVTVKIGWVNLKQNEMDAETFLIFKNNIYIYPEYSPATIDHDIALIRLPQELKINHLIQMICLGSNEHITTSQTGIAAGWGILKAGDTMIPDLLHEAALTIQGDDSCNKPQQFICAHSPGKDTCGGDSGGPLMIQKDGRWYQIGVVSHGPTDCGDHSDPGQYTRIPNYLPWIRSYINF
ncbi:unnamed protein product, partial [Meganyctiphanes norvegica]